MAVAPVPFRLGIHPKRLPKLTPTAPAIQITATESTKTSRRVTGPWLTLGGPEESAEWHPASAMNATSRAEQARNMLPKRVIWIG